jgi:hypothetical protein
MSGKRFDELNDAERRLVAEAEADLERLLSVEPSPEFAARVRTRISAERQSAPRWMSGWRFALAAASLAIVGIVVSLAIRRDVHNVPQPVPAVASGQRPAASDQQTPASGQRPAASDQQTPASDQQPAASGQRPANEPEVLVAVDQVLAMERLIALASAGKITEEMLPAEPLPAVAGADARPVAPLLVQELQVPVIGAAAGGIEKGLERH